MLRYACHLGYDRTIFIIAGSCYTRHPIKNRTPTYITLSKFLDTFIQDFVISSVLG